MTMENAFKEDTLHMSGSSHKISNKDKKISIPEARPLTSIRGEGYIKVSISGQITSNAEVESLVKHNLSPEHKSTKSIHDSQDAHTKSHSISFKLFTILCLMGGICVILIIMYFTWLYLSSNVHHHVKYDSVTTENSPSVSYNYSEFVDKQGYFTVKNYLQYNQLDLDSNNNNSTGFNVVIFLDNEEDWPIDLITSKSIFMLNIAFVVPYSFKLSVVQQILKNSPHLEELSFKSIFDPSTTSNKPQSWLIIEQPVLSLSNLTVLTLEQFSYLLQPMRYITDMYRMPNLVNLQLVDGRIDDNNVHVVEKLIGNFPSLQRLEIRANISTATPVFTQMTSLSDLTEVIFEWELRDMSASVYNFQSPNTKFCDAFSNLRVFKSKRGSLPLEDILRCKNLQTLNIGIDIDNNSTLLPLFNLNEHLLFLTEITLYFSFRTNKCPSEEYNEHIYSAFLKLRESLQVITFKSNCIIRPPDSKSISYYSRTRQII